jgi:hypothetical protein
MWMLNNVKDVECVLIFAPFGLLPSMMLLLSMLANASDAERVSMNAPLERFQ